MMPLSLDAEAACSYLSGRTEAGDEQLFPAGAARRDYLRSPVASRIGELAKGDGLFCFNYEHRRRLELPESWLAPGQEQTEEPLNWAAGNLSEPKYQSFRHDLLIGSFHPGHRGKWTTHELCHALVGFAWRPDATPFFHATAARLAELLPVVVYYFFDEVRLQRCDVHANGGPLFQNACARCEDVAAHRPFNATCDPEFVANGIRFIESELAAIRQSRREGRPKPYRYATLELCSDGLAYARAHQRRLRSRAFHDYVGLFGGQPTGMSRSLDELEARVLRVAKALFEGQDYPSHGSDSACWQQQDLAMRLLQIREDTEGEAEQGLEALAATVAAGSALEQVHASYTALADEFVLPDAATVFATGYPSASCRGRAIEQVTEGLAQLTPLSVELAKQMGLRLGDSFTAADLPARQPLAERLASWLGQEHPGPLAELAQFEHALAAARCDGLARALGQEHAADHALRLADGFRLLMLDHDVVALAEAVEDGKLNIQRGNDGSPQLKDPPPRNCALVIGRNPADEVVLVEIPWQDGQALRDGRLGELGNEARATLLQVAALVPTQWTLSTRSPGT